MIILEDIPPIVSLPPDQLMIGPSELTKTIKITLDITTQYNTGSVRDLLVDVYVAMKANLAAGTLTSDWGHHLDIEIMFGNQKKKEEVRTEKVIKDAEQESIPERRFTHKEDGLKLT